eukprot:GHUV01025766.1.p1 GENE.GHUV01025766.1~~GHUV01025766.1.p1  ORF type:complete len:395 (+),score=102.77 GHUV01025766.1:133-1317(+)
MLLTRQWNLRRCLRPSAVVASVPVVCSPSALGCCRGWASQLLTSKAAEPQPRCRRRSPLLQRLCASIKDKQATQGDAERFQALLNRLKGLSYQELLHLSEDADSTDSQVAFSASFLFWLSAQEKKAKIGGTKQELANLAAQLVYIKEQADYEASRRMLPPLASSLAYSNYSNWQADHQGQQLPDVASGVSIADLYKAAEREEAKLQQWQTKQRPTSTVDTFAAASGYQQAAADAMARVRARLMGFTDDETYPTQQQKDGEQDADAASPAHSDAREHSSNDSRSESAVVSPAAEQILQELLTGCSCREERAIVLPEAMMPPGLEVRGRTAHSVATSYLVHPCAVSVLIGTQGRLQWHRMASQLIHIRGQSITTTSLELAMTAWQTEPSDSEPVGE